jgi:hypothetical protein
VGAEGFSYRSQGRTRVTALAVTGTWLVLGGLVLTVDAAPWLMGCIGLFTLPALWDLWRNPQAGLDFTPVALTWFSGAREGRIPWAEIDRVRLDTRLDFSVRASAVLRSGQKIRLPYECTPPHRALEAALAARGIPTERHHFSLAG